MGVSTARAGVRVGIWHSDVRFCFDRDHFRVLDLDATRATHAKPLSAHPELDKWRFGAQTGELWAALGEAWVTTSGI